ncbi:NAD(P)H-binding protein [Rubricoccus marinus]|uniref:NAD(P)-binding domain-containing protein n=1 Tax=Rubricoccus marinus TaxID=716817 RepID=A0A259TYB0_9BACT|nr:NAD(P)H-binding protein [Rubricoccus marinus]OZC02680.1 hypothetical protein BSZ36_06645 [Rubricoccus marinus]
MPDRTASGRSLLLLGASGLVGGHVLRHAAHDPAWGRVVTLGRRPMPLASGTHEHHVVDFRDLDAHADLFGCDAVACCLGTTIKTAGSQEAFRFVDYDLPLAAARLAHTRGARAYGLVSAYGADADSRIFYNRTKGEAEDAVRAVGFEHVVLMRPSLLTGDRDEDRTGEKIGEALLRVFNPVLIGPLRPLRPTPAEDVAVVLTATLASATASGVEIVEPVEIRARATELQSASNA